MGSSEEFEKILFFLLLIQGNVLILCKDSCVII